MTKTLVAMTVTVACAISLAATSLSARAGEDANEIVTGPLYLYGGDYWTYVDPALDGEGGTGNMEAPDDDEDVSEGAAPGDRPGIVNLKAMFERPPSGGSDYPYNCYGDVTYDRGYWGFENACGTTPDAGHNDRYGRRGDTPLVGNWDGQHANHPDQGGWGNVAVVRRVDGRLRWFLETDVPSDGRADIVFDYGSAGDVPVVGTWSRSDEQPFPGLDKPGVIREREGTWHFYLSTDPIEATDGVGDLHFTLGSARRGDEPYVGKLTGCCQDFVGVVRGNRWFVETDRDDRGHTTSDGIATRSFRWGVPAGDDDRVGVYERPICRGEDASCAG